MGDTVDEGDEHKQITGRETQRSAKGSKGCVNGEPLESNRYSYLEFCRDSSHGNKVK